MIGWRVLLLVAGLCGTQTAFAQTEPSLTEQEKLESIVENSSTEVDLSELEAKRIYLAEHPLNLNFANTETLLSSGLFNELQVAALQLHIQRNGILLGIEELQSIDGFTLEFILSIQPYVKIRKAIVDEKFSLANIITQGKNEVILRDARITESQAGYQVNKYGYRHYAGDPWKTYARYRFRVGSYFSLGITGEKDAGEQLFKGTQSGGFDFYSAHLFIKPGNFVHAIALGDYQVQYGQGLVQWSGMAYGKGPETVAIKRQASGIQPYSSVNEYNFLRGFAISMGTKKYTTDFWLSNRKLDANLHPADTSFSDFEFSYINQGGYHRTYSELDDKGKLQQRTAGMHSGVRTDKTTLGFTAQYSDFSYAFAPGNQPYQQFNSAGKVFVNAGIDYSYRWRNLNFFGETAVDRDLRIATLNGLMAALDARLSISMLMRYYPVAYQTVSSNPFRENTNPQNEQGMYFGIQYQLKSFLKLNAYFDCFQFPWMKYKVTAPTAGTEWMSQLTYTPSRNTEVYLRVKAQDKPMDGVEVQQLIPNPETNTHVNVRINFRSKLSPNFTFQSRMEWTQVRAQLLNKENGTLFLQDLRWHPMGKPWHVSIGYALFKTDSYDSRVYGYEQEIPGSYSIPGYYYEGFRYFVLVRCRVARGVDIWVKYSRTKYTNRNSIGTADEAIMVPHRSEIKLQVRYVF